MKPLFFFFLLFFSAPLYSLTIVIDPGHGGADKGAQRYGLKESQITLAVSQYLKELIEKNPQLSSKLTRTNDNFLDLQTRAHFANKNGGDLFLSIHVNSSIDKNARGTEFYFHNQLPPNEEALFLADKENHLKEHGIDQPQVESKKSQFAGNYKGDVLAILDDLERTRRIRLSANLAKTLHQSWSKRAIKKSLPIRQAPFFVITNVNMPSVLIELGYISNPREASKLNSDQYQKQLARSIYQGIVKFKEVIDKTPKTQLH